MSTCSIMGRLKQTMDPLVVNSYETAIAEYIAIVKAEPDFSTKTESEVLADIVRYAQVKNRVLSNTLFTTNLHTNNTSFFYTHKDDSGNIIGRSLRSSSFVGQISDEKYQDRLAVRDKIIEESKKTFEDAFANGEKEIKIDYKGKDNNIFSTTYLVDEVDIATGERKINEEQLRLYTQNQLIRRFKAQFHGHFYHAYIDFRSLYIQAARLQQIETELNSFISSTSSASQKKMAQNYLDKILLRIENIKEDIEISQKAIIDQGKEYQELFHVDMSPEYVMFDPSLFDIIATPNLRTKLYNYASKANANGIKLDDTINYETYDKSRWRIRKLLENAFEASGNGLLSLNKVKEISELVEPVYEGDILNYAYIDGALSATQFEKSITFEHKDLNIMHEGESFNSITSTIDVIRETKPNHYEIGDFKSGHASDNVEVNKIMKYQTKDEEGRLINLPDNADNRNKLKLMFAVLAIKNKNPEAIFDSVYLTQDNGDGSFKKKDLYNAFASKNDMNTFLLLLEQYFKQEHSAVYKDLKARNLFDYKNYISVMDSYSGENGESMMISRIQAVMTAKINNLPVTVDGEIVSADDALVDLFKMAHKYYFGTENINTRQVMSARQRHFQAFADVQQHVLRIFRNAYEYASKENKSYTKEYEAKLLDRLSKLTNKKINKASIMNRLTNQAFEGWFSDSKKFSWNWAYKDFGDTSNKKGVRLLTYVEKEFASLTSEQQEFLDYARFDIRFEYYKTFNPIEGIQMINEEINSRQHRHQLSQDQIDYLQDQIEKLYSSAEELLTSFDILPSSYNREDLLVSSWIRTEYLKLTKEIEEGNRFRYTEGWFPKYRKLNQDQSVAEALSDSVSLTQTIDSADREIIQAEIEQGERSANNVNVQIAALTNRIVYAEEMDKSFSYNLEYIIGKFANQSQEKRTFDSVNLIAEATKAILSNNAIYDQSHNTEYMVGWLEDQQNIYIKKDKNNLAYVLELGYKIDDLLSSEEYENMTEEQKQEARKIKAQKQAQNLSSVGANIHSFGTFLGLSFKPIAGLMSSFVQTVSLVTKAIADNVSAKLLGKEYTDNASISDIIRFPLMFMNNEEFRNKIMAFSEMMDFLPDEFGIYEDGQIGITYGSLRDQAKRGAYLSYSFFDKFNYLIPMYTMLKNINTTKNGKVINMFEAYEIVNNKLMYTGDVRGVLKNRNKIISGLIDEEIRTMKGMTRKLYGSLRPDEKTTLSSGIVGTMMMSFKNFIPGLVDDGVAELHLSTVMGQLVKTDKVDANGLPIMQWESRFQEGYAVSFWTALMLAYKYKGDLSEVMKNLTDEQKKGIILLLTKAGMFFLTYLLILGIYGDDDKDKYKRDKLKGWLQELKAGQLRYTIVADPEFWTVKTVTPATAGAVVGLFSSLYTFAADGVIGGEIIKSGEHKGEMKGLSGLLRKTPVLSSYYSTADWIRDLGINPDAKQQ